MDSSFAFESLCIAIKSHKSHKPRTFFIRLQAGMSAAACIADVSLTAALAPGAHAGAGGDSSSSATLSGHKRIFREVPTTAAAGPPTFSGCKFSLATCSLMDDVIDRAGLAARSLLCLTFSEKDWCEGGSEEMRRKYLPSSGPMNCEVQGAAVVENAQEQLFTNFHGDTLSVGTCRDVKLVIKMVKAIYRDLKSLRESCKGWCDEDEEEEVEEKEEDVEEADALAETLAAGCAADA